MSGNTGTFKATPVENSTGGFERTVAIVKELAVGDNIAGLDADKQPTLCTVEAIGPKDPGAPKLGRLARSLQGQHLDYPLYHDLIRCRLKMPPLSR